MIWSPRKTCLGSWCPLVENRDEWGSLFRGDPIKSEGAAAAGFLSSLRDLVLFCRTAIAALKRRSSTLLHAARWHADPTAQASKLFRGDPIGIRNRTVWAGPFGLRHGPVEREILRYA